jgi:asparagine synthase (glutamine-hydrolysing)
VAFVWEADDVGARETVARLSRRFRHEGAASNARWECVLERAGMLIFQMVIGAGAERAQPLPEQAGVIVGQVFPEVPLSERTLTRLLRSRGQTLVDDRWGRYVAFLYDPSERVHYVVRDPSGQMPCYWLHLRGANVFFAALADVLPLVESGLTVNWSSVRGFLQAQNMRVRETGFNEITEVFAGERVTLAGRESRASTLWDPARACALGWLSDATAAATEIRRVTESCVAARARVSGPLLLNLSGGFDSAVVLGCLTRLTPRPHLTAVNRYLPNPDEDERTFARAAAAHSSVELVEWAWGASGVDVERILTAPILMPRPSVQSLGLLELEERTRLAQRTGATATWTGQGGDHLFFQMKTPLFVADHVQRCGLSSKLGRVIDQAARLTQRSYVSILRSLIASNAGRSIERERPDSFLRHEVIHEDEERPHPWIVATAHLPPAKRLQCAALVDLVHAPLPCEALEAAPACHPLISQPLIETCLRIPSDVLLLDGRLRGLAHEAFREHVPEVILNRDSKGATRSYLVRIIRENIRLIREHLLDGLLMSQQLLDRARLEAHLLKDQPLRPGQLFPLLSCITAELWLRSALQRTY